MNYAVLNKQLQNPDLTSAMENPSAYSEAFFSVHSSDIEPRLASSPQNRQYLVEGFLPQGIAGLLAGPGAVGKTMLTMQLGAAVATGTEFLGQSCNKGSVLMYLTEDDDCEIAHRLHRIRQTLDGNTYPDFVKNLKIFPSPLIHLPMFDYDPSTGAPGATQHFGNFWAAAQKLKDLKLIVIDSYTRINNLDEVNHSNASYVALCLEMLARDTGATVLMIHHPPKHGSSDTRGSSALLNALRWTASLGYPKKGSAGNGGLELTVAKHNYGPTVYYPLQRQENGLLCVGPTNPRETQEERDSRMIDEVCSYLGEHSDKKSFVTFSELRALAGLDPEKRFQIRQTDMKSLLEEACKQGKLIHDQKKGYTLALAQTLSAPEPKPKAQHYEAF